MLPSLSKHFIKALLKPIIRGATPDELKKAKGDNSKGAKAEYKIALPDLLKRRGNYRRTMNRSYAHGASANIRAETI